MKYLYATLLRALVLAVLFSASGVSLAEPVALNQDLGTVGPGRSVLVLLSYSGRPTNFTIVTPPLHGSLLEYSPLFAQYQGYTAASDYTGEDFFTWKCADSNGESAVATCTVMITSLPSSFNSTNTTLLGQEVSIYLPFTDPMDDRERTFTILSGVGYGVLQTASARYGYSADPSWYVYTPTAGVQVVDTFTWSVNNGYGDSPAAAGIIAVVPNTPPVASNSTSTVSSCISGLVSLPVADPDTSQIITFTLIEAPAHGAVSMPDPGNGSGSAVYTSDRGYVGLDSFVWKVNDGMSESGQATATVVVAASIPVPYQTTECTGMDMPLVFDAPFTGGGGYTCVAAKVTGPSHGTLTVTNGSQFAYRPASGFTGPDSFTWKVSYSNAVTLRTDSATVGNSIIVKAGAGADWPQWRQDEYRSAATVQELPDALHLLWRRDFPAQRSESIMEKDQGCQPVIAGRTLVMNMPAMDKIVAYDTGTGDIKWSFYADGPVRQAPVVTSNMVYAGSDDGFMYCLNLTNGALISRQRAGGGNRKIFGNKRLISPWMVRGGAALSEGRIYYASGLWPLEGIFAFALDAETGTEIWRNDGLGGLIAGQPHDGKPDVGGPSPQGYLVMRNDRSSVMVPGTEAYPADLDLQTGRVLYWCQGAGTKYQSSWGSGAYPDGRQEGGYKFVRSDGTDIHDGVPPVTVTAGRKTFTLTDVTALGVAGTITGLAAADGKLFAVTRQGSLYCFGGTPAGGTNIHLYGVTGLEATNDIWTTRVQQILAASPESEGCVMVWGIGSGRLVDELLARTSNKTVIVAIDPDTNKVQMLRERMDAAGYYGTTVAAFAGNPADCGLPPYIARLILSADPVAAGVGSTGFASRLYYSLMPYGGMAWLPLSAEEHSLFAGQCADLALARTGRTDPFSTLQRTGLKDGSNRANGKPGFDKTVNGRLGVLWFTDPSSCIDASQGDIYNGRLGGNYDAYTGLPMTYSSWDRLTGVLSNSTVSVTYTNPLTGIAGPNRLRPTGYGCGTLLHSTGYILAGRGGNAIFNDQLNEAGTVNIAGIRSECQGASGVVGDGILYFYGQQFGCICAYSLKASLGLVPVPEAENWARWGNGPTQDAVEKLPVRRLGINFGAPGSMKAEDGKLWLPFPPRVGPNPLIQLEVDATSVDSAYHHSSRILNDEGIKWVSGSNLQGLTNVTIRLTQPVAALRADQPPVLDGVLSDACWDDSGKIMLNNSVHGLDQAGMTPAYAWARYDATNLYFAMSRSGGGTYWHVYVSDRVQNGQVYAHFIVGASGSKGQTRGSSSGSESTNWVASWSAAAVSGSTSIMEMAVPWSTLENIGLGRNNITVNMICGNDWKRLRDLQDTAFWSPVQPYGEYQVALNSVCKLFSPLTLDAPRGRLALPVNGVVKLHFAETEGATAGQRVFDVSLNGQIVETNFDIYAAAGGADRTVVRTYSNVVVQSSGLNLQLIPRVGQTLISGLELDGEYQSRTNQAPVANISVTGAAGYAAQVVSFSAAESCDPDGQIVDCIWDFGDGDTGSGTYVQHSFGEGTYAVRLVVLDDEGVAGTISTNLVVGAGNAVDFVCSIRASGGDYTTLTAWEAAVRSSLTSTGSLLFGVSALNDYSTADDGRQVTFSGGSVTGTLKHINGDNVAYVVNCTGPVTGGVAVCASGHTFGLSGTGRQIRHAVAECYNDWPAGLSDNVTITGWGTSNERRVVIRAAEGNRHNGTISVAAATGFTVRGANTSSPVINVDGNVVCRFDGLCVYSLSSSAPAIRSFAGLDVKNCVVRGGSQGVLGGPQGGSVPSLIVNSIFHDQVSSCLDLTSGASVPVYVYACTLRGATYGIRQGTGSQVHVVDCLIKATTCLQFSSAPRVRYTATSDGTAASWGGDGNRANQTFLFLNESGRNLHLALGDTAARGYGSDPSSEGFCLVFDDVDGQLRPACRDIGADQTFGAGALSASFATPPGTPLEVGLTACNPAGDALAWGVAQPDHGVLAWNADVRWIYTPAGGHHGIDSFSFSVTDGVYSVSTGMISITVNTPVSAPSQSVDLNEGGSAWFRLAASDADGDLLAYSKTSPAHGALTGTPPDLTYTPYGSYYGTDVFSYVASDGYGSSATASVNIIVHHVNHAPVAQTQRVNVLTNRARQIVLTAADQDACDVVTCAVSTQPAHGALSGTGGTLLYTPDNGFAGIDSFKFTANDGTTSSAPATVWLDVGNSELGSMPVMFTGYTRPEVLTNFPVLVVLSNNAGFGMFNYSQMASPLGWDLRCLSADGSIVLNHEIEQWNTGGVSYVWVQVPVLTSNSSILVIWGDTNLCSGQAAFTTNGATWSNGYVGVWHLSETGGLVAANSSGYGHALDGVLSGSIELMSNGVIGSGANWCADSANSNAMIKVAGHPDLSGPTNMTVSYWYNTRSDGSGGWGRFIARADGNPFSVMCNGANNIACTINGTGTNGPARVNNQWRYGVLAYASGDSRYYDNASLKLSATMGYPLTSVTNSVIIGNRESGLRSLDGIMDEIRISKVCRSTNWVWAEFVNAISNSSFNSYGVALDVPSITRQPASAYVIAGERANFSVVAGGTAPLVCQWFRGGLAIAGATNTGYSTAAVSQGDDGAGYYAVISNKYGAVTSSVAVLNLIQPGTAMKMQMTFAGYEGAETLTGFPVLVTLSNNFAGSGFSYNQMASPNGWDLRFTDGTGANELNYEIESWDTGGVSCVWVQIPLLTATSSVRATWGNVSLAGSCAAYTTNGSVWSNGYCGVYHFAGGTADASPSRVTGSNNGTTNAAGLIGAGRGFGVTGTNFIELAVSSVYMPSAGRQLSVSAWFKPASADAGVLANRLFGLAQSNSMTLLGFGLGLTNKVEAMWRASDQTTTATNNSAGINMGEWHLAAFNHSGSSGTLWLDGASQGASSVGLGGGSQTVKAQVGRYYNGSTSSSPFHGEMDELRVSSVSRSLNWLRAEYLTVVSNSTFCVYGSVRPLADTGTNAAAFASWQAEHFGSPEAVDAAADADPDRDGMNNRAEWLAGTDPRSVSSSLTLTAAATPSLSNFVLSWSSAAGRTYSIDSATNLATGFSQNTVSNIPATPPVNTFTAQVDQVSGRFYRVRVE